MNAASGNYVQDSCMVLNDCGAIYVSSDNNVVSQNGADYRIINNQVANVVGDFDGVRPQAAVERVRWFT